MEGRVDDAGRDTLGDLRAYRGLAGAAAYFDSRAVAHATLLGVVGMNLEHVLMMPHDVGRAAGLRADVVLGENSPGGEDEWEARPNLLVGRHVLGDHEVTLAAYEMADVHHRRTRGCLVVARPLHRAEAIELFIADAGEGRFQTRDFVHYLRGMRVVHRVAERGRELAGDLPVGLAGQRRQHLAHARDAPFRVGE